MAIALTHNTHSLIKLIETYFLGRFLPGGLDSSPPVGILSSSTVQVDRRLTESMDAERASANCNCSSSRF